MAKNAQFYLLNPEKKITVEQLACDLAAQAWRLGKRVLIACETEEQAFLIDEAYGNVIKMSLFLIIFQAKQHNMHRQLRLLGKANAMLNAEIC